jgi:hypothetical protein
MYLEVDGYKFPVNLIENSWDSDVVLQVGNPHCRPKPCLQVTFDPNGWLAGIDILAYHTTCSVSKRRFERGSGAIVLMVKAALQWLMRTYPKLCRVVLADESYFTYHEDVYLLPEKMILTEGQTWYQKHFGAVPDKGGTHKIVAKYQRVYEKHGEEVRKLPDSAWLSKNIEATLKKFPELENIHLSGRQWSIHRKTIEAYDIPIVTLHMDGGGRSGAGLKHMMASLRRPPRPRIWYE